MSAQSPRVAILGLSIECNRFAPVTKKEAFNCYLEGQALIEEARKPAPAMLPETPSFVASMDRTGPWTPVPLVMAMTEPGGPIDHPFFEEVAAKVRAGLKAALPLDGVYFCAHGAAITTEDEDPEGTLFDIIREIVGPKVPMVASFDLHGNVSRRMVDAPDVFIGYRTNPHLDMGERGEESALALRKLLAGTRTAKAFIKLPIIPPTVTMLTAGGPYADMIDLGQQLMAPDILNVTVMGGFAYGDTTKNGLCVIVTADDSKGDGARRAHEVAAKVAAKGWANRDRFRPKLTSLDDAVTLALATKDPSKPALCFADVADNPGGGARGNTTGLLKAFHEAGVEKCLLGIFNDPELAAEAHRLGEGAAFRARFNRAETQEFSKPFEAEAKVLKLSDGRCVGRRGIYKGMAVDLGPSAAIEVGGITVVVISNRAQCGDPVFFEMFGLDIAKARTVIVKSRGHFRGGFDEFFKHEQIVEVDLPGLTSPVLARFPWKHLPRPVVPLDETVTWQAPAFAG
jgi:microcystin degradation protein MlrC